MLRNNLIMLKWKKQGDVKFASQQLNYAKMYWRLGIIGGIGMMASYGLALWAMTFLSVVMVAALRETSILFAMMISAIFLKETIGTTKVIGACLIVARVIVLRLA